MSRFIEFGDISVKQLSALLFLIGAIGILVVACINGYNVYLANTYDTLMKQGDWYTGVQVNNLPLGILSGMLYFIIGILFWRVICEIVYIILNYFKNNTKENV